MGKWTVTDPTSGQSLDLEGDSPPSEEELTQIFSQVPNPKASFLERQSPINAAARAAIPPIAEAAQAVAFKAVEPTGQVFTPNPFQPEQKMPPGVRFMRGGVMTVPPPAMAPSDVMEQARATPLYQWAENLKKGAEEAYPISATEAQGITTKAAGLLGGFLPFMATGPAAPVFMAFQGLGQTLESEYQRGLDDGLTHDQAAQAAMDKAKTAGAVQTAIFSILPEPLRKLGDKFVDKVASEAMARFLAKRVASAGTGAVLGAASGGAQAAIEGKPILPAAAESAAGLGMGMGLMPYGKTAQEEALLGPPDALASARVNTANARAQAWANTFGAGGPRAETAILRPEARVLPTQPYVAPEPGPLTPILSPEQEASARRQDELAQQIETLQRMIVTETNPLAVRGLMQKLTMVRMAYEGEQKKGLYAPGIRNVGESEGTQLPRTEARQPIPENIPEIRTPESAEANAGNRPVAVPPEGPPVEQEPPPSETPTTVDLFPEGPKVPLAAPATFKGIQQGVPTKGIPDAELWNLTEDIPGHSAGSTVSRKTLEDLGYTVPPAPETKPSVPETPPSDFQIAYNSILEKQGKEAADKYAAQMANIGKWHPSANYGIEPPTPPVTSPVAEAADQGRVSWFTPPEYATKSVEVDFNRFEKQIASTYWAGKPNPTKTFTHDGKQYATTGIIWAGQEGASAVGWEFIPSKDYKGPTYSQSDLYAKWDKNEGHRGDDTGLRVKLKGKDYVLGNPVHFFAKKEGGETPPAPPTTEPTAPTPEPAAPVISPEDRSSADKLRKLAAGLESQIEDKRRPMTQNPTPKRMKEYRSRLHDANNLERGRDAMLALAAAYESGTAPKELASFKNKNDLLRLVYKGTEGGGYYEVIPSQKYAVDTPAAKALQALLEGRQAETPAERTAKEKASRISQLEAEVQFSKLPGFFPTPKPVIERMVEMADIREGDSVLEPSAGKGDIAEAVRTAEPTAKIRTVESSPKLQEILREKGFEVAGTDFLEHAGQYDRILMNPPFENGQDAVHVRRAYDQLKPGGRLVSVMSEGPFFRSDRKSTEFREWLQSVGGTSEDLPAEAFKSGFRPTGVKTRLVEITRPAEVAPKPEQPAAVSAATKVEPRSVVKPSDVGERPLAKKLLKPEFWELIDRARKEHEQIEASYQPESPWLKSQKLTLHTAIQSRLSAGTQAVIRVVEDIIVRRTNWFEDLAEGKKISGSKITDASIPNSVMISLGYEKNGRYWEIPSKELPASQKVPVGIVSGDRVRWTPKEGVKNFGPVEGTVQDVINQGDGIHIISDDPNIGVQRRWMQDGTIEKITTPSASVEEQLKVPIPDVSAARERVKSVDEYQAELREKNRKLLAEIKDIEKLIKPQRGNAYARSKIKASARRSDVTRYRDLQTESRKLEDQIQALDESARADRRAIDAAVDAQVISDENQPLIRRLDRQVRVLGDKAPKELIAARDAEVGRIIKDKYPDATPEEVARLAPEVQLAAYFGGDVWAARDIPSLPSLRRAALEATLNHPDIAKHLLPEALTEKLKRFSAKDRPYAPNQPPIEDLSAQQLADLKFEIKTASDQGRADLLKKQQEEEAQKAVEEAKGAQLMAEAQQIADSAGRAGTKGGRTAKEVKNDLIDRIHGAIDDLVASSKPVLSVAEDGTIKAESESGIALGEIEETKNGFKVTAWKLGGTDADRVTANVKTREEAQWVVKAMASGNNGKAVIGVPGDGVFRLNKWGPTLLKVWMDARGLDTSTKTTGYKTTGGAEAPPTNIKTFKDWQEAKEYHGLSPLDQIWTWSRALQEVAKKVNPESPETVTTHDVDSWIDRKKEGKPVGPPPETTRQALASETNLVPGISEELARTAIERDMGGKVPKNVTFVTDPSADFKARASLSSGEPPSVLINLAKLETPEAVQDALREELIHGVWEHPSVSDARAKIEGLVKDTDVARQIVEGYAKGVAPEEAANQIIRELYAKHSESGLFKRAINQVVLAVKRLFGIDLSDEQAALHIVNQALKNLPGLAAGERQSLARTPAEYEKQKTFDEAAVAARGVAAHSDIARMKEEIAGNMDLSERARRLIGQQRSSQMRDLAIGESNSIENYAQARDWAKTQSPHIEWNVTKDALHSLGYQQKRSIDLEKEYLKRKAKIESPRFIQQVATLLKREKVADVQAEKDNTFRNIISVKVQDLMNQISKAKTEDARTDQLRQDMASIKRLTEFTAAVSQKMDQIVSKVYPRYWEMNRSSKSGQEYVQLYEAVRRGEGDPLINAQERSLVNIAAEVLGANRAMSDRLYWLEKTRREPDFAPLIESTSKAFAERLQKDPAKAIVELMQRTGTQAARAAEAKAAFLSLQEKTLRQLTDFHDHEQAFLADSRLRNSPQWRALINQVNQDAGAIGIPEVLRDKIRMGSYNTFTGDISEKDPYGKLHQIKLGFTPDDTAKAQVKLNDYLQQIQKWLYNPENADHPDRAFWERQFDFMDAVYNTAGVLDPGSVRTLGSRFFRRSWDMPQFLFLQSKVPAVKVLQTAFENWHRVFVIGQQWSNDTAVPIVRSIIHAMDAHKMNPNLDGTDRYRDEIFNSLAWAYRHNKALQPGDKVFGKTITKADIEVLRKMGGALNALMTKVKNLGAERVMPQEMLFDQWAANTFAIRKPQEFGAERGTTVPREISQTRGRALATEMNDAKTNPARLAVLNDYFDSYVLRWMGERSADYSEETPFEPLFKQIIDMVNRGDPDAPKSVEDVADFINRNTGGEFEKDAIQDFLVGAMAREAGKMWKNFYKPDIENAAAQVRTIRATRETPFTTSFEKDQGSSFWYDYGMVNAGEVRSTAIDSTMFHLQRLDRAMTATENALSEALGKLTKYPENSLGRREFLAKQKDLYQAGKDFRDFEDLQMHLHEIKAFHDRLPNYTGEGVAKYEGLTTIYRLTTNNVLQTLSGIITLGRVFTGSVIKQALVLSAFERFQAVAYVKAAVAMLNSFSRLSVSGPIYMAGRRVGLMTPLKEQMSGWAEELFRTNKYFDQQYAYGLGFKNHTLDSVSNNLRMPVTHGAGYSARLSQNRGLALIQRGAFRALSAYEAPIEAIKTIFPTLGYSVAYDSVARQTYWTIRGFESRARRTFNSYEKAGQLGRFDFDSPSSPQNRLTPKEMFGDGILPATETQKSLAREFFKRGTDVDLNDQMIRFFKKLQETPKADRNSVHLLSADAKTPEAAAKLETDRAGALATIGLYDVHHASPANRAWFLRSNVGGRLALPLAGWSIQSTRQWFALMGQAAADSRLRPWALATMTGLGVLGVLGIQMLAGDFEKRIFSWIKWLAFNEVDPVKHLREGRDAEENAKIALSNTFSYIPALENLIDLATNERSNRKAQIESIFLMDKIKSMMNYVNGVIHTGDPTYGLANLARRDAPWMKPLVNRTPGQEGLIEEHNVRNIIQKYADEELLRAPDQGGPSTPTPTPLTPIKEALANAIYKGDSEGVRDNYYALIAKASEMGKADPEKVAQQMLRSLNPYSMALAEHPTDQQRLDILSKLTDRDRQILLNGETNFLAASQMLGVGSEMVKQEAGNVPRASEGPGLASQTAGLGGAAGGSGGLPLIGGGGGRAGRGVGTGGLRRVRVAARGVTGLGRGRRLGYVKGRLTAPSRHMSRSIPAGTPHRRRLTRA